MRIVDELLIDAPVDTVWRLTEAVESWPQVTPTMTRIERLDRGPLGVGSRARVKQPAQPAAVWTVTEHRPRELFAWETSRLGMRMVGADLLSAVDGRCRNTLTLELTGRGSAVFACLVGGRMRRAIHTENEGFKRAAETGGTP